MKEKTKDIIESIVIGFFTISFVICIFSLFFYSCNQMHKDRKIHEQKELEYGLKNPTLYEIVYTNNDIDTIKVWRDYIRMDYERGTFKNSETFLEYIEYKKYNRNPDQFHNSTRIYNVVRYKKLK